MTAPTGTQLRELQKGSFRTRLDPSPSKPKPEKRQCAEPGCETWLSSYNEGETCSLCGGGWPSSPVTSFEHREDLVDVLAEGYEAVDGAAEGLEA